MKRLLKIFNRTIFFTLLFILSNNVFAMSTNDIKNRNACNTLEYELGHANIDGSISTRSCHGTYQEAKNTMDSLTDKDLIILERKNNKTEIIDAKYALIDYDFKVNGTSYIYKNKTDNNAYTYIGKGSSDDAAYLELDFNTKRIKIKVSGVTGWIDKYDSQNIQQYDIIPINWIKTPSYYKVDDNISHVLPGNLYGKSAVRITFGPKPDMLNKGNYYSFDGKYFYNELSDMIDDYKSNKNDKSINKDKPYYNYYLYLSHRSKSNYSASDIDGYITNILGFNSKITNINIPEKNQPANQSMLYNEGKSFYETQENFGVNALMNFSVARNESGNGRSYLSFKKNNLFGHGAIDKDPFTAGDRYLEVKNAIEAHAYKWLSYGFLQPGDYNGRFRSSNLGNKNIGVNVKYASDPSWGEKAAAHYYSFDYANGLQDYNYYKIGVQKENMTIYPKKTPDEKGFNVSSKYYKLELKDTVILIVDEVESNGQKWYKIMSDPMLDRELEYTGDSKSNPRIKYSWNSNYVYVPANLFYVINDATPKNPNDINNDEVIPEIKPKPTPKPEADNKPSTDNPSQNLENRNNNLYYYENIKKINNNFEFSGFMAITGMDNGKNNDISHRLIVKNVDNNTEYVYKLNRWLNNYPFEMTNSDEKEKFNYNGGWFKGNVDFSNLPQGNYQLFIEVSNGKYKSRTEFNNLFFKDMVRKTNLNNGKGIKFSMNYLDKNVPMELEVRDEGLISTENPPTIDTMFNNFDILEFRDNKLHIKGTSHNVGIDYSNNVNVKRTIILENTSNYNRYSYDIGSINNGPYKITLRADDGKDKTRAWFDANLNLNNIPSGTYAIYIKTIGNGGEDYGELVDLLYTNVNQSTTINGKKAYLKRVDNKRFRIELVIK